MNVHGTKKDAVVERRRRRTLLFKENRVQITYIFKERNKAKNNNKRRRRRCTENSSNVRPLNGHTSFIRFNLLLSSSSPICSFPKIAHKANERETVYSKSQSNRIRTGAFVCVPVCTCQCSPSSRTHHLKPKQSLFFSTKLRNNKRANGLGLGKRKRHNAIIKKNEMANVCEQMRAERANLCIFYLSIRRPTASWQLPFLIDTKNQNNAKMNPSVLVEARRKRSAAASQRKRT